MIRKFNQFENPRPIRPNKDSRYHFQETIVY